MTFEDAEKKINSLLRFGVKPGLERLKKLLNLMDNPQDKLQFVHVAGTNGKGSVCTMAASVLQESGYKTGLFTSPFTIDFRERFQINSEMISENDLSDIVSWIFPKIEALAEDGCIITEFELVTAIAFEWFNRNKCDVVVMEVGLGGRFDATNVIKPPLLSIITSISLDHTAILGESLEKIAFEKAGIIKPGSPVVLYPGQPEAVSSVIEKKAEENNSEFIVPNMNDITVICQKGLKLYAEYKKITFELPFPGDYQVKNTLTALTTVNVLRRKFNITDENLKNGIEKAKLPARLEVLNDKPLIILDGAHNDDAFLQLAEFIKKSFTDKNVYMIIGILRDKAVQSMVSHITPHCKKIFTVKPDNQRALTPEELCEIIKKYNKNVTAYDSHINALKDMAAELNEKSVLIICGSLYLAKSIKEIFSKEEFKFE